MIGSTGIKISIVTPCYNSEKYIGETVRSVISNTLFQNGAAFLEYIICDGGSIDQTRNIVDSIRSENSRNNIEITFISEPDGGMYEALAKGITRITGDICAYINAGDFYSPTAFEIVKEMFEFEHVNWITGLQVSYNDRSHMTAARLPFKFRQTLCQRGIYGKLLPFIQQESTFWRASLTSILDLAKLSSFKSAGDYYIWHTFSKTEKLYIVEAWLGGFRTHRGQISEDKKIYLSEMKNIADKPKITDYIIALFDKIIWGLPSRIIKLLNTDSMFFFDHNSQRYVRSRSESPTLCNRNSV